MARATIYTHLSLDRMAKLFGLNPVHFQGAAGSGYWPVQSGCDDVWRQWGWQRFDVIAREDLAQAIHDAEEDIKRVLGYPVAPEFITAEKQPWTKFYESAYYGGPVTASAMRNKAISAKYGKVIAAGRRATTIVDADAAIVYSDPDGDGFEELATITATTSLTDSCEIKVYVAGKSADPTWEIRPLKTKTISGTTLTITLDSWLLLDPTLWEAYPTDQDAENIDIEDNESYLTTVDIYREYVSTSSALSQFAWETGPSTNCLVCGGSGCASCTLTTQNGCLVIRDADSGIVTPLPATYDSDEGTWTPEDFDVYREPDYVSLWYQAGYRSEQFLSGNSCEPLSDYLAQAIAWLAIARLEAPPCGCGRVEEQFKMLRRDLAEIDRSVNIAINIRGSDLVTNPFGTREGEYRAWNRISRMMANETHYGGGAL